MDTSLAELASFVGGKLVSGDPATRITGFSSFHEAEPGDVTFSQDSRRDSAVVGCRASALLIAAEPVGGPGGVALILVPQPSRSFERIVEHFGPQPDPFVAGVHPTASVSPSAVYDAARVSIGPNAVVGAGAILGAGAEIGAGCYVGTEAEIGADSSLRANATVHARCTLGKRVIVHSGAVIGADGFGYEFEAGRHRKVRQAGRVQIDDDVEIGAGCTIDRARFGRTWIGEGTKIDNLVQVGHNVVIGRHCIIVAGCAIAGSATIGDYVVMAAQCGVAGHVTIGSQAVLGSRCGVTKDLPGKETYLGYPAVPAAREKRRLAATARLAKLNARVAALEARLGGAE